MFTVAFEGEIWSLLRCGSKMKNLSFLFIDTFIPVLVTSNFDDASIKNERASMETPFSHYKSMRNSLDAQAQQITP